MSAARTILLGTALGLAVGAAALAQEAAQEVAPDDTATDFAPEDQPANTLEIPLPGVLGLDPDAGQETTVEVPFPEGEALIAAADELIGARVYDTDDVLVGEVSELMPATGDQERRVVIDIGGFLGFGETPVAVDADAMTVAWTETGEVDHARVAMSEAQLEQLARADG